jgi:GNAT superfamily N-acetyltransferase
MSVAVDAKTGQELCLERATQTDRDAMVEMYQSFDPKGAAMGLPPWKDPGRWLDSLAPFPNFLVRVAGRIAGHGVLCVEGDTGETAIFVHQEWRGHGIGKLLLAELIEEGRRLGLRRVWGMAAPDNFVMLRLAESLGFVPGSDLGVFHLDLKKDTAQESSNPATAA